MSVVVVSWISRFWSRAEVLEFSGSSGERGDLIMAPKKSGPEGGESRVGARKYVLGGSGILRFPNEGPSSRMSIVVRTCLGFESLKRSRCDS